MSRKLLRSWTFLVGAGASLPAPSKLPNGESFSGKIFDLLTRTGPVFLEPEIVSRLRGAVTERIRLEIFLETLASEISPAIAFSPFEMFSRAVPNFNHFAIAMLAPRAIITTNQDLLLEEAAMRLRTPRRIIHLHGRCDNIPSIVTIVSQYLGGLERHLRNSFKSVVAGGNIVIVGYSGRDMDVMPLLVSSAPRKVKWILHTGSSVSPELSHAKEILGRRLEIVCAETGDWLKAHLNQDALRQIKSLVKDAVPVPLRMPPSVQGSFRGIPLGYRNRAIAKVLEHLGEYRQAAGIYQALAGKDHISQPQLLVDLARVRARVAGHDASQKIYARVLKRSSISSDLQAQALLGNIDALRNSSKPVQAARQLASLDQVLKRRKLDQKPDKTYWRLRGWALSARAGICRIESRVNAANRLYGRAELAFSRARDIDGRIEVLTWRAESELILGDYKRSIELSDSAIRYAVAYGKYLVRGWPSYVKAEALALSGRCDDALREVKEAKRIFKRSKNIQGPLWSLLLEVDCFKEIAPKKINGVLDTVRDGLRFHQLAHVQSRLYLEEAEVARAAGDWLRVMQAIAALRAHLKNKTFFTEQPRMLIAHALLVEAECARQQASDGTVKLLKRARAAYERIGAKAFVARVNVALSMAGQLDIPVSQLLEECRRQDYRHELARLKKQQKGFYPIHFV
jgi:tetratricopeptide (TPR) repeat protein